MFFMHRVAFRIYNILTYQKKKKKIPVSTNFGIHIRTHVPGIKVDMPCTCLFFFLISNKTSLIKKRDTQAHREYTRENKSKTKITKVK